MQIRSYLYQVSDLEDTQCVNMTDRKTRIQKEISNGYLSIFLMTGFIKFLLGQSK